VLVSRWESATHPPEVGRVDLSTGRWTALTQLNAQRLARIDLQPLRDFWFTSSSGKRIHNFIALPPAFDPARKYPLFVLIHGGPHAMWRDHFFVRWNYHLLAAPGYVVLLTNYSGSTGFGEAHAQSIQGDPLQGPGREINEAADAAIRQFPFIDPTRQAAGGASYGGHLTNWLAVTTDRYRALVSHAGLFDLKTQWSTSDIVYSRERNMGGPVWADGLAWREQSPLYRAARLKTPMLLTIGERDYRVPINNTFELWTALQRQKVPSRLVVFPEENHWIAAGSNSRFFYGEVRRWLDRYLVGEDGAARGVASR
jgi:dipeptidyl aminopeptidase/acylaminoacyl peptidase